jgi:hypothetical protein
MIVQVREAKAAFCSVFSLYEKGGRIVTWKELSPQPHRKVMADPGHIPWQKSKLKRTSETVLKLPDLERSNSAVMNSLTPASSERCYDHAIATHMAWSVSAISAIRIPGPHRMEPSKWLISEFAASRVDLIR